MRAIVSILVGSMIFLSASLSNALAFTFTGVTVASGRPLNALTIGDEFTVGIRMSNPSGATIFGIGAGIQGWDNNVLTFVSAEMNAGPYFCTTASCGAGLENVLSLPADPVTGNFIAGQSDVQQVAGVGNYLPLVQAIALTGRAGSGARDPGLDGVVNGGDAQFRLVFRYSGPGATTITIGTNTSPALGNVVVLAGGATEQAENAFIFLIGDSLILTPEPGTALLVGLGLAVLAARTRRSA